MGNNSSSSTPSQSSTAPNTIPSMSNNIPNTQPRSPVNLQASNQNNNRDNRLGSDENLPSLNHLTLQSPTSHANSVGLAPELSSPNVLEQQAGSIATPSQNIGPIPALEGGQMASGNRQMLNRSISLNDGGISEGSFTPTLGPNSYITRLYGESESVQLTRGRGTLELGPVFEESRLGSEENLHRSELGENSNSNVQSNSHDAGSGMGRMPVDGLDQLHAEHGDGVGDNQFGCGGSVLSPYNLCCLIKSRTRESTKSKEIKKSIWFEGKPGGVLKIGSAKDSGLLLKDDRCEKTHALIKHKTREVDGLTKHDLVLYPCARMYRQINPHQTNKLSIGTVIKIGSISLEVINMDIRSSDDFSRQWDFLKPYEIEVVKDENNLMQAQCTFIAKPRMIPQQSSSAPMQQVNIVSGPENNDIEDRVIMQSSFGSNNMMEALEPPPADQNAHEDITLQEGVVAMADEIEETDDNVLKNVNGTVTVEPIVTVLRTPCDDVMCYICWGNMDISQHRVVCSSPSNQNVCEEVASQYIVDNEALEHSSMKDSGSIGDEEDNAEDQDGDDLIPETAEAIAAQAKRRQEAEDLETNPVIRNPCGNCSGTTQFVHLQCLMKWIKTSKSGHCSICNGVLPSEFCSKPPNLELKIIRHRRGHHWVGSRRFRLSFAENNKKILGSSYRSDVRLNDCSISDLHCIIKYDKRTKGFVVYDNHSKGGTYLQVMEPVVLNECPVGARVGIGSQDFYNVNVGVNEFKIGRSMLTVKVVQSRERRNTLLKLLQKGSFKNANCGAGACEREDMMDPMVD